MSKPTPTPIIDETIVRDIATGDLSVAIDISKGNNKTYLRMGDAPDKAEAIHSHFVIEAFNGSAKVNDYSHGFIHGKQDGTSVSSSPRADGTTIQRAAASRRRTRTKSR